MLAPTPVHVLIIEEAVRSIENKTESRELNLRLIERISAEEQCLPIQHIVNAIQHAVSKG